MFANFEIRQKNLDLVRSIYGNAIGLCPKDKIFDSYIQLELQLGNMERCRTIYEKWLQLFPQNCNAWLKYCELEDQLGEFQRCRAIYDLAIQQPLLDLPEILWKSYIDFEIMQKEYENARRLYNTLLDRTKHVKVWISFAQFEHSISNQNEARQIYSRAYDTLKSAETKEERVMLVESWKEFEQEIGDKEFIAQVQSKMPKRIIKKRPIKTEDGVDAGSEEYYDYIFPGEESSITNLKILERAKQWKKQKQDP